MGVRWYGTQQVPEATNQPTHLLQMHLCCFHIPCCLVVALPHPPQAAPALMPPSSGIPPALPLLIELGCSFGNTVTLPLLYLMTMLSAADSSRAAGFMSLFHAAWSPCLWVFGYSRVQEVSRSRQQMGGSRRPKPGGGAALPQETYMHCLRVTEVQRTTLCRRGIAGCTGHRDIFCAQAVVCPLPSFFRRQSQQLI